MKKLATLILLAGCVILLGATRERAGELAGLAQVVALDECDPTTFNAFAGPDFCKNVTLGCVHHTWLIYLQERRPEPPIRAGTSNPTR